jgi:hypothetical protein
MVADQQTANDLLGEDKAVGKWTAYGNLRRYGWIEGEDRDPTKSMAQDALEVGGIFEELSINADQNEKVRIDHSKPEVVDGRPYKVNMELSWLLSAAYLLVFSRKPMDFTTVCLMSTPV